MLSEAEIEALDNFLLYRTDEEDDDPDRDEGIIGISELDGFLTAIVSGPVLIPPSQWLPVVWGEFEPVWESEQEFQYILSLLMRHMNGISTLLMQAPQDFEAIFMQNQHNDKSYLVVDEWCEGYVRGVRLAEEAWIQAGEGMSKMLAPILAFTEQTRWLGHDYDDHETELLQQSIEPRVRDIHAYWLVHRGDQSSVVSPQRRSEPRIGRNSPCPCGSGKKYKKCCLH